MTSRFNAKIEVDAEEKTNAVFDSVNIDNKFYPENPTKTEMFYNGKITANTTELSIHSNAKTAVGIRKT